MLIYFFQNEFTVTFTYKVQRGKKTGGLYTMNQFVRGFKYMQEKINLFKKKYCEIIAQNHHFHHDKTVSRIMKYSRNLNRYIGKVLDGGVILVKVYTSKYLLSI